MGARTEGFLRYPISRLVVYNGITVLQYLLGGLALALGFGLSLAGYALAGLYLVYAFGQMYLLMPLMVCRHCTYYTLPEARCISGLNLAAKRIAGPGSKENFSLRAQGLLCHNNFYLASFVLPILLLIPALIVNFSFGVLALLLALVVLVAVRMLIVIPRVACGDCQARNLCPNAQQMGLSDT